MKLKEFSETEFLSLIWGLFALGTVCSVIRFTVRWKTQRRFYSDDWFALASWLSLLIMAILYTTYSHSAFFMSNYTKIYYSTGLPPPVDPAELDHQNRFFSVCQLVAMIFFWTTLWAGKFSLLAFYKRLMDGVQGYMRWWWVVVVINILTYWASFLSNFLACLPLDRRWTTDRETNCATPESLPTIITAIEFASGVDIATDILIMMLPIPLIWGLRIPSIQKLGLAVIFCLGTIVIVFAIFRLKGITDSISVLSYTAAQDLAIWSMVECSVAVVVISLPALRGLLANRAGRSNGGYNSGPIGQSGGIKSGNIAGVTAGSQISNSGHIKLHDISITETIKRNRNSNARDAVGSSSQEELRRSYSKDIQSPPTPLHNGPGINMTTEVFVSSVPGDGTHRSGHGHGFGF